MTWSIQYLRLLGLPTSTLTCQILQKQDKNNIYLATSLESWRFLAFTMLQQILRLPWEVGLYLFLSRFDHTVCIVIVHAYEGCFGFFFQEEVENLLKFDFWIPIVVFKCNETNVKLILSTFELSSYSLTTLVSPMLLFVIYHNPTCG